MVRQHRCHCPAGRAQAAKRLTLSERLLEPVKFEYQKAPLKVVIEDLKERTLIPIYLDVKKFEEEAISLDIPISGKSSGASAIDDINKLLRGVRLTAEVRLDLLYISPLNGQKEFHICRLYRLPKEASAAELVKRITSKIAATTWRDAGGSGEIVAVAPTVIAIFHTPATHREIERKLGKELSPVSSAGPNRRSSADERPQSARCDFSGSAASQLRRLSGNPLPRSAR